VLTEVILAVTNVLSTFDLRVSCRVDFIEFWKQIERPEGPSWRH
jgi:hypothetical protein